VYLLGVPSNSASYTHLAGRTARFNREGKVITLLQPKEIYKFISIIKTLSINVINDSNDEDEIEDAALATTTTVIKTTISEDADDDKIPLLSKQEEEGMQMMSDTNPDVRWNLQTMSKTAISSRTVSELRIFLESKNISTKRLLKNKLVEAVLTLKKEEEENKTDKI
jgi:superfamily II DNA/RNA helicase